MAVITSMKPQRNQKRVNVYLDGKFGFGLDLENFVKLGLKVEQELSDSDVEKIVKKAEFQKTLDKLLRFATLRPRSEKEIRAWFKKHKVHESLHKGLFKRLARLDLIGDEKFAKWWVEQRLGFRPKSKRILKYELKNKGIKDELIDTVLSEVIIDEVKIAKGLVDKKKYRWKNLNDFDRKKKMATYLSGKGFGWEIIEKILGESVDE